MINIFIVITILFFHWVFDFVFQTDYEAKNKSKNNIALYSHTWKYSVLWFPVMLVFIGLKPSIEFVGITFLCHTITDYYTSRLNTKLHKENRIHDFFVSIGFDQWLHYCQLFLTFYLIYGKL